MNRAMFRHETHVIQAARALANLAHNHGPDFYRAFSEKCAELFCSMLACPFVLDMIRTAATGNIGQLGQYAPDVQIEWDAMTNARAAIASDILRAIGTTPLTTAELAASLSRGAHIVADTVELMYSAGAIYPDAAGKLHLSILGEPMARYLDDHPDAIRPDTRSRRENRRRH